MKKDAYYYQDKYITIPNLLSAFRLCLIPLIVWLYCFEEKFMESAIVVIISGITDIVDGFIARHFNMVSNFGKFLDPFADKMTQMTLMVCLAIRFPYMLIPCVLLFVKEFISFFTAYFAYKKDGFVPSARWHGKLSTVLLYTMIFVHIIWFDIPLETSKMMVLVCTIIILLSFFLYESSHLKRLFKKA